MKYIITDETIQHDGHTLHRIKALKSFDNVKAGDLGGWIQSENNLSQEGNCWVYDNAKVYGRAKVYDNAQIYNNVIVCGEANVYGNANVFCEALIYNKAKVDYKVIDNEEIDI